MVFPMNFLRLLLDAVLPSPVDLALAQTPWAPCAAHAYCARCGESAGPGEAREDGCSRCAGKRLPWARVTRLDAWGEPVQSFVAAMKYRGHFAFAPWLGGLLAQALALDASKDAVVAHVPMHWTRRVARGYDQADLLADAVAAASGFPRVRPLARARRAPRQAAQTLAGRERNARGAFRLSRLARRQVQGRHVVLVDDVKTTGATLRQCARLLKRAGAASVQVAVVAVADRRR
jgi:ComF family protein